MKVRVEDVSSIEKKLSIEVEQAIVADEVSKAYGMLSRQVKVPGFRPGKVPRRILEQRYKAQVEDDVVRRLISKSFYEAVTEHAIEAVSDPTVTDTQFKDGTPFSFTAVVEVRPKVEAKEWKGLKLPKAPEGATDKEVAEQLERIRESMAEIVALTGRDVAQLGDWAVIDFHATIDGQPFAGGEGKDVTVEVSAGELTEGNLPALAGAKIGVATTFDYTFPADYRVESAKGKTAKFTATIKELKQRQVPPADDALAVKLEQGVKTLAELKEKLKKDIGTSHARKAEQDLREAIFKGLAEKNPFELPKAMLEHGINVMIDGALRMLSQGGVDPRALGASYERLREEFKPKAELEVRGQLLLEALAKQEKLEVTAADFEAKLKSLADESGSPIAQVQKAFRGEQERKSLEHRIREEKTLAHIAQAGTRA